MAYDSTVERLNEIHKVQGKKRKEREKEIRESRSIYTASIIPPPVAQPTPLIYCTYGAKDYEYPKAYKSGGYTKEHPFSEYSLQKINAISEKIKCKPEDLQALILSESDGKASAYNKTSKAAGLIQFLPSTAKEYGLTTEKLRGMSQEDQLDYVEKYLADRKSWSGFKNSESLDKASLYCLVLCPSYAKKGAKEALYARGSIAYKQNRGLDLNNDGKITKVELAQRIDSKTKEFTA